VTDAFRSYRRWFYAAAIYNAVWGSAVVLFPGTLLRIVDMHAAGALPLVQVMGMGWAEVAGSARRRNGRLAAMAMAGLVVGLAPGATAQRRARSRTISISNPMPIEPISPRRSPTSRSTRTSS
jgi:hypothetical protein